MTHNTIARVDLVHDRAARRWSPRLGYALATGGSALVWTAIALAMIALT